MAETTERSAVLIVRAWVEGESSPRLFARITHSTDLARTEQIILTTAGPDAILAAVRAWLDALLPGGTSPPGKA
jgi:hypothetical protein